MPPGIGAAIAAGVGAAASVASTVNSIARGRPTPPDPGIGLSHAMSNLADLPVWGSTPKFDGAANLGNFANKFSQSQPSVLAALDPSQFSGMNIPNVNLGQAPQNFNSGYQPQSYDFSFLGMR